MPINGYFYTIFATDGDRTTVPDPLQVTGDVSYDQGYPVGYSTPVSSGGINVERQKFNQVMYDVTSALQQYQQVGTPNFITSTMNCGSAYSYSKYDRCIYGGVTYISVSDANTDTPGASEKWRRALGAVCGSMTTGNVAIFADTDGTIKDGGALPTLTLPSGIMVPYAGSSAPSGWLLCYGQAVSRTTYADLFTAIGTTWGAGDGSTTFNLPDLRGRAAVGKDNMGGTTAGRITAAVSGITGTTLGATGGAEGVTLTEAQLAAHTHTGTTTSGGTHSHALDGSPVDTGTGTAVNYTSTTGVSGTTQSGGTHNHTFTTNSAGSDNAHNNVQPTAITNYIIKT